MPRLWRESLAPMMITSSPSSRALADNSFHLASKDLSSAGLGFSCGFPTSAGHASPPTATPTARATAITISRRLRFTMTHSCTESICFGVINFIIAATLPAFVMRPVGRPSAMPVRAQLQPYFAAFFHRVVALSIDHNSRLSVDLNLVFDSLSDEEHGLHCATDHSRRRLGSQGRKNFDILGTDRNIDELTFLNHAWIVAAPENNAVWRALKRDGHLPRWVAALHFALEQQGPPYEVAHELIGRLFVEQPWAPLLLHNTKVH